MTGLVTAALDKLVERYVFPEKAVRAAEAVRARLAAGEYDGLDDDAVGAKLTADLNEICADHHLRVRRIELSTGGEPTPWRERVRLENYGIAKVEWLDGNIGLIDLRAIANPAQAGPAIAAAMELVAHTVALIIDLRRNRGGSPDGVAFWNTYLFPDSLTFLNSIYDRESDGTKQFWTFPYVPGSRYLDRPVYVLTSRDTFSGGEEFAYNLKVLKRATIVGETTRGGAHPTDSFPISPTMEITVPTARSINPVTGTNWEGVGVEPDVPVPADEAFDVAYRLASGAGG